MTLSSWWPTDTTKAKSATIPLIVGIFGEGVLKYCGSFYQIGLFD